MHGAEKSCMVEGPSQKVSNASAAGSGSVCCDVSRCQDLQASPKFRCFVGCEVDKVCFQASMRCGGKKGLLHQMQTINAKFVVL